MPFVQRRIAKWGVLVLLVACALAWPAVCLPAGGGLLCVVAVLTFLIRSVNRHRIKLAVDAAGSRILLIYSTSRGWADLINNNVLPLVAGTELVALDRSSRKPDDQEWLRVIRAECVRRFGWGGGPPAPFLISLRSHDPREWPITPLHQMMLPFKPHRKPSGAVQEHLRWILDEARCAHHNSADKPSSRGPAGSSV